MARHDDREEEEEENEEEGTGNRNAVLLRGTRRVVVVRRRRVVVAVAMEASVQLLMPCLGRGWGRRLRIFRWGCPSPTTHDQTALSPV